MRSAEGLATPVDDLPKRIVINNVTKRFARSGGGSTQTLALADLSFEVDDGTFLCLLGPSGCGKTTLLRLVDGLIEPDAGTVRVFGKPPKPGPDIGFVFQSFRLIPWANIQDNVEFGLRSLFLSDCERKERAKKHIKLVGLDEFRHAYPSELSGGMKQRAALARALATEPDILLMDEPFASIDAHTRELMQLELMRIWTVRRPTVLFVTHSVDEAIILADKILLMSPRPGRVVETIDVGLERPRWAYDARAEPEYIKLRSYLSNRMRDLVLSDPASEFFGRDLVKY